MALEKEMKPIKREYRPEIPYAERPSIFDKYGGHLVRGWAFPILDRWINGPEHMRDPDVPRVRSTQVMHSYHDMKIGLKHEHINTSSVLKPTHTIVIAVIDCAARHEIRQVRNEWAHGWSYYWQERNMLAGGGGHCDDLDDALATFDKLCGRKPQQSTLF